ncbi:chitobiase/beta-hexosaminidase C-terminal domain-containing protein [Methanobacterium bryantii]|uniref:PKD domain-containing protein n=2 Tax=Methanobacterium TaxID=2160 RepID=A0A2A2H1X7_METBR|nr:chitobiase/beta-hexosaminidase C-terminal domain-containing protein [Methanobacterium bryantii]PAV03283.1 hypothetical protein ASJ80_04585 [Methanobacterium bryantii]
MKYNKLPIFLVFALLACILTVGSVSAADTNNPTGLANSSYPEYGINNNHTSQSNYTGPQTNTTKWNNTVSTLNGTVNGTISGGSAVTGSDGTIYFGSSTGFYALNPNGTVKWTYDIRPVYSAPAIGADGTIYVCNITDLYALTDSGTYATPKWNYTLAGQSMGISIAPNGTIYLGTSNGYLYSITDNGTSAIINWIYHTSAIDTYASAPSIGSDGTLYVLNGKVLTAITDNGDGTYTVKWTYSYKSSTYGGISIGSDGTIYVGTSKVLYAVTDNGDTYTVKWSYTPGSTIYCTPAISSDGTIYILTGDGTKSTLYAITDNGDGTYTVKWSYDVGLCNGRCGITIGADGTIYFGTMTGMYAITDNGDYGTLKWNYTTNGTIQSAPVIGSDGTLYVGTTTGVFYAFQDLTADFTNTHPTNGTVSFTDNSTNIPTSWNWSFGDGATSTEQNPTHTYSKSGKYTVTLTVTNADGVQDTTSKTIYIVLASANPVGGNYSNGKTVNLATDDTNATIYYTLNGTDPTLYGTKYTGPLTISKTTTVKYAAVDNGNWSSVYTQTYTIAPSVTASPVGGSYNTSKTVTLKTDDTSAVIYYTTNGTDPKLYGTKYTGPITISKTTTLKYVAVKDGNWGIVTTQTYTIDKTAPTASANYKSGWYNKNLKITLKMSEAGTIYYITTGATSSKKYTGAFTISKSTTLKFRAVDKAGNKSPVYTVKYVIDKTAPKVSAVSPKSRATGVSRTKTVSIRLSENVLKSVNWSKVYIKNIKTGKKCKATIWISGNHIYIKTSKKASYTWYRVYIPAYSIKDKAGNYLTKGYSWIFKTGRY